LSNNQNTDVLLEKRDDGITFVHLNRPTRLNAMTADLVEQLHQSLETIGKDATCRVVILTGSGKGFCAGLDLNGYGTPPGGANLGKVQHAFLTQKHISSLISHMRRIPQPIIAAVNGAAAGGGLALVLGSDVRIAARSAKFNVAFIRVGYSACDIGTSWLLPRIVGVARAQELMLTGRVFDCDEAHRIGLITHVYDDSLLIEGAVAKANEILANSPFAVSLTKEAMWTALEIPSMQAAIDLENRQQIMTSLTNDAAEAMNAFVEKRPPKFTNS
jgi:enoyl-CoA hydratase